jgi:non-canonical purine NTP pyrophosphatase (RdgB/HAM1 family)
MKKIYFISKSEKKAQEVADFLKGTVEVEFRKEELPKIQSAKIKKLVKKKAKEAYKIVRRPVLVEHTSFCIDAFHELKGLDTNYFSSVMGYDNIIGYCEYKNNFRAYVESVFCLCNGKDYFIARAKDKGEIRHSSENVKNLNKGFGWDTIFVPNESNPNRKTYEELKREDKDRPTMRRKALKKLKDEYAFQEKGLEWDKVYEDQEADLDQLAQLIFEGKVMLFAGAGLSASLGFPTWDALIGELGENAGYKKGLFKCHGNYMMLAEYARMMENKDTGKGAYEIMGDMLKISKEMESKLTKPKVSVIYQKLLELNFPVIYTTNYDHILEEFYRKNNRKCQVMYPQTEIADACAGCQDTRIMKFHGDVDALTHKDEHADSIVLSESQYFERMDFQSDMDQQFLRDMKEYHVLFLGYSLSDINVKMLMYLARKLRRDGEEPLKAYIYTATPNLIQREVFLKSGIVSFAGEVLDKKKGTEDFLDKLLNRIDELKAEGK